jgi:hypothetical protein
MSDMRTAFPESAQRQGSSDGRGGSLPTWRARRESQSSGWFMFGLAAVAVGALAWYHFGGDVKRYIKMERM